MTEATIPVDLSNPGQVFACLGFMEAAEILCGPVEGGFGYQHGETNTTFSLAAADGADPIETTIHFLAKAEVIALAPLEKLVPQPKWRVTTEICDYSIYPGALPDSPAALALVLRAGNELPIDHWLDGEITGRDNVKFWAGAQGKPGAAFVSDLLAPLKAVSANSITQVISDPFAFDASLTGGLRFDWRRDYIALDAGFSPNVHKSGPGQISTVGYLCLPIMPSEHSTDGDRRAK
jgi:CRISPR-associated protein Csx14